MGCAFVFRTSVLAAIAVVLGKVLVSCVDLESLGNGPPDGAAPPRDSSVPDVVDPCLHAQPAATSELDDDPGAGLPTFVLAVDTVTVDPDKVSPLDLDDLCTCDTRPGTAGDGGPSCAATTASCDEDGGADNKLGLVAREAAPLVSLERVSNRLIATGHRTLLLQLKNYNGRANDREVVVGTLVAEGIRSKGCASSVFDPARQVWSAGRCGDDPWTLSPASVATTGTGNIPFVQGIGYVRDNQLVVRLNNPVLLPFNDETTMNFVGPILTGRLVPLGEDLAPRDPARAPTEKEKRLFRIENGLLAGRVLSSAVLGALGSFQQSSGTRLCASAGFGVVRDTICGATDMPGQGKPPFVDTSRRCDALSAAVGFVAIPALAAEISDAGVPKTGCESIDAAAFLCP